MTTLRMMHTPDFDEPPPLAASVNELLTCFSTSSSVTTSENFPGHKLVQTHLRTECQQET